MARQPVYCPSSWLPSPRFELWTLVSYNVRYNSDCTVFWIKRANKTKELVLE